MLKQKSIIQYLRYLKAAAFGRLCVETSVPCSQSSVISPQPPSGGCVLKLINLCIMHLKYFAAAFGRLCVETLILCYDQLSV